ncbi:TetR/AcrR family transcriptional regulator [Kurthia gibsonii]|uniref:TetR/AcrR family transcriptional regulator n=1 Tax=Kurthia gibsonii TaxID=33946 RepID=UPI0031B6BD40
MDRRHEILVAANKSFTLFGYKATTMDQVARMANVGKGTIYTFFENKDVLFQEIVMGMIEEMKNEAERIINPNVSFLENAHQILMKLLQFRDVHKLYAKLVEEGHALRTPQVENVLKKIENEILTYISSKIQIAIDKKEIKPCNPEHVAYLVFKVYLSFVVEWSETHDEELDEHTIVDLFKNTLFGGLTP